MRQYRALLSAGLAAATALAGCAHAPPSGPAPRACGLAEFAEAPGITLPNPPRQRPPASKSAPVQNAAAFDVNKDMASAGKWYDAAPGWKAWRVWLRSDSAAFVSVHLQPFEMPDAGQAWVCSPDGTTRQGPVTGRGPGGAGQVWSAQARGPELWIEVLVPAGQQSDARLVIQKAYGGYR